MDKASDHPPTCQTCRGSGWQHGPDIDVHALNGHYLRTYTTAEPCTHHWQDDEYPKELISLDEYLRRHPEDIHLFTTRS